MNTAAMMQKVAQVAPEKFAFLAKTAAEIRKSPFRDEIVAELDGIVKKAGQGFMQGGWGTAAKGIGAAVGTSIAISLAGDMFDATKRGIFKSRNYRAMMKGNPELAEHDAKQVQRAFSTLHRFNPEFSGDPNVAGAFVRKQVELNSFDPQMLTNLVGARKNLSDIKKLPTVGKMPWESSAERKSRGLEDRKLEQDLLHGPEQHKQRMSQGGTDPEQQRLWRAQAQSAHLQAVKNLSELEGTIPPDQLAALRARLRNG